MKLKINKILWVLLILIIGSGFSWLSVRWSRHNVAELSRWRNSKLSPVIMIPGSSATESRFDRLVAKLNQGNKSPHSLLKIRVTNDDQLHYSGRIRPGDNEPIIVVGFENNHDGYQNIKQQARRFNIAFKALSQTYNFNNFKAIGHSNGGLIYTRFLENEFAQYRYRIRIKRLMTIGSPYNFNEKTIDHKTQMLSEMIHTRSRLPQAMTVYSIAGTQTYNSDGLVPLASVEAGKYIFQGRVKHYTAISVSGADAQHSDLPQNQQVVALIKQDVLDHPVKKQASTNTPYLNQRVN